MTLRFVDSFDHYQTADILGKYTTNPSGIAISAGNGRRSTQSLRLSNTGQVVRTIDAQATWVIGFAFKTASLPSSANIIVAVWDAGTTQCDLRINADGTLAVTRNGTTLSTSASNISAGSFYYIEFKVTINNTTGSYNVKVNGTSFTSGTGVNTRNTANNTANQVAVGTTANRSQGNIDYDDLYVCDGAGSTNNDFLGDVRVDAYMPSGDGNSSQLTGSDGNSVNNSLLVDEALQNGDTDYVQSSTSGNKDTYAFTDMSHTPTTIFGLQINMWAKKDDSGARSICSVIRSGGSDTDGTTQALGTSYQDYMQISETDPATSAAWSKSGLNSAEFGVKVAA